MTFRSIDENLPIFGRFQVVEIEGGHFQDGSHREVDSVPMVADWRCLVKPSMHSTSERDLPDSVLFHREVKHFARQRT